MQQAAHKLSQSLVERGFPPFRMGLGINTGLVRVGDMGSYLRRTYTALGDPVNLASRLEGLTKYYHCDVLVSESVVERAPAFVYRLIDRVRVKGKDKAIAIFIPLCERSSASDELLQLVANWNQGLGLFYEQRWDEFLQRIQNLEPGLLRLWPEDAMLHEYRQRAERYRQQPPPQPWDGVVTFDEK
jgi:adenylate cyclase